MNITSPSPDQLSKPAILSKAIESLSEIHIRLEQLQAKILGRDMNIEKEGPAAVHKILESSLAAVLDNSPKQIESVIQSSCERIDDIERILFYPPAD